MPAESAPPVAAPTCVVIPSTEEVTKTPPAKIMGEPGCGCAKVWVTKMDGGRQMMRICLEKDFDWRKNVKPSLPGEPDWCPATHFGFLESGEMHIQMKDDPEGAPLKVIKAGESYFVPPGHLPVVPVDTVMVEFSQDTTYTNKDYLEKK